MMLYGRCRQDSSNGGLLGAHGWSGWLVGRLNEVVAKLPLVQGICYSPPEMSGIMKYSPRRSLPRVSGRTVNPIRSFSAWFSRLWE